MVRPMSGAERGLIVAGVVVAALAGALLVFTTLAGLGVSLAEWLGELRHVRVASSDDDSARWVYLVVGYVMALAFRSGDRKVTLSYEDRSAIEAHARAVTQVANAIDRLARGSR